ncbi:isocitrate dehydrogenase [NAD] [Lates japonicus]|uniref:Isocitrate dehydrogenase [NAD] n=1 Tax=Lates japonicus TaxID=270547 RepID=A0AAD3R010_LATJO|nr:isocitrate dehydrogenase [NAD] [Lates japonicus]
MTARSVRSLSGVLKPVFSSRLPRVCGAATCNQRHTSTYTTIPPPARYGGRHTVTLIPGDGIGPELANHVRELFRTTLDLYANVMHCQSLPGGGHHRNIDIMIIRRTRGRVQQPGHENVPGLSNVCKITSDQIRALLTTPLRNGRERTQTRSWVTASSWRPRRLPAVTLKSSLDSMIVDNTTMQLEFSRPQQFGRDGHAEPVRQRREQRVLGWLEDRAWCLSN